jgi:hypothetical protein
MSNQANECVMSIEKIVGEVCELHYRDSLTGRDSELIDEKILDVISELSEIGTLIGKETEWEVSENEDAIN